MKKAVLAFIIAATMVGTAGSAWAKELKVGYINLSLVFDSYEKTKAFDADLQKEAEEKRVQREKIVEDVKKLRDELELMSAEARVDKQAAVDEKVQELQAFDRDIRLALRRKRDTMIREILKEIDDIIQAYGNEKKFDYIYNDRVLLYKTEEADISQDIISRLNKS